MTAEWGAVGTKPAVHRAAVLQSSYIPWRGYFDLIASVDDFILYDDVQMSNGRDWRNRNQIKTSHGLKWLTISALREGRGSKLINEVYASNLQWGADHWNRITEAYRKAPFFDEVALMLKPVYLSGETHLSTINRQLIEAVCNYLGIETRLHWSTDFSRTAGKSQRLADLVEAVGASVYVSGPAAKDYLDESVFAAYGQTVEWFSYSALKPYPQLHGEFMPAVSIIDLLFNCGPISRSHLPSLAGDSVRSERSRLSEVNRFI